MFNGTLLPYQPTAVNQMVADKATLVAYDLGLGKTVLTIAAIEQLMDDGQITEPGLVICLSSLKYQWADQIEKFSDSTPLVIDGTPKQREQQYQRAYDWPNSGIDYVILNYEQVVNDWDRVKILPRGFVVLDEATAIKSFRSKRSRRVKKLNDAPVRYALTGTPMENGRPEEIFSIMEFVDHEVLGRSFAFDARYIKRNGFGGVERYQRLDELHARLAPSVVRKRQSDPDVVGHLPAVIHNPPILVPMDRATRDLYRVIVDELKEDLAEVAGTLPTGLFNIESHYGQGRDSKVYNESRGRIMSKVAVLKMLCDDPKLVEESALKFNSMQGSGSEYANTLKDRQLLGGSTLKSRKLTVVDDYVSQFLLTSHTNKLIIFTMFVGMSKILAKTFEPYGSVVYTGEMNSKAKEAAKVQFQTDPNTRVMVSTDAGGYGVDLPQANMLVNYDLPWSSGTALQRNGRIRRASSRWPSVVVQDFLMKDSIEVRQHAALIQKASVATAVVDGEGVADDGGFDLTLASLSKFLNMSEGEIKENYA